jgi:hypothetical protein
LTDIGRWTLDVGHWTLDIGHWTFLEDNFAVRNNHRRPTDTYFINRSEFPFDFNVDAARPVDEIALLDNKSKPPFDRLRA